MDGQEIDISEYSSFFEDTGRELWTHMCQAVHGQITKEVKRVATAWSKLDCEAKLVQLATSYITRREVAGESDFVLVIGNQFWEEVQGQETDALKTIHASGIRPAATSKVQSMTIREARDATGITKQSRLFQAQSVLSKAVDGEKATNIYAMHH